MPSPEPAEDSQALLSDLVVSLDSLRDELTHLSLMLQDMQFHMDTDERNAAVAQVHALMEKINGR